MSLTRFVMDLWNVDIVVKSEDQTLILLGSHPAAYEMFMGTLLYTKRSISREDVSNVLKSKELNNSFSGMIEASTGEGLAVRGRLHQQDNRSDGKTKSKASKVICYRCLGRKHY